MTDKMKAIHKRFVEEYLVDLNATKAYRRAGFKAQGNSAEVNAHRLLRSPKVAEAVEKAMAKRSERAAMSADRVIQELERIATADIRKAVKWSSNIAVAAPDERSLDEIMEDGPGEIRHAVTNQVELVDSDQIDDDTAAAIAEISMTDKGGLKIKFHDKQTALGLLARHHGLLKDKVEVEVTNLADVIAARRKRAANRDG